jgi:lysophospholipase L1-like esterase
MPLTTVESASKARVKRLLGRTTVRDVNAKRNRYNTLLRQAYAGREPLFDIAALESTHADGRRSFVAEKADTGYTLAEELTTDGGHLNERGQRVAAEGLLAVLARVAQGNVGGGH